MKAVWLGKNIEGNLFEIERIHYQTEMLNEEQLEGSIEIEDVPVLQDLPGKYPNVLFDNAAKEFVIEYLDAPLSNDQKMQLLMDKAKTGDIAYREANINSLPLSEVKQLKINQLKQLCTEEIHAGFESSIGHAFGFNEIDQENFTQQTVMIVLDQMEDTETLQWKAKSGVVELTVADFKTVIRESKDHKLAQQGKYWQLEAQVLVATSKAAVDAINW